MFFVIGGLALRGPKIQFFDIFEMFFVIGSLALRGPKIQKMTFFEKMSFLTFLGLETIGKRSGVVESVGWTNSQSKWMEFDYFYVKFTEIHRNPSQNERHDKTTR